MASGLGAWLLAVAQNNDEPGPSPSPVEPTSLSSLSKAMKLKYSEDVDEKPGDKPKGPNLIERDRKTGHILPSKPRPWRHHTNGQFAVQKGKYDDFSLSSLK